MLSSPVAKVSIILPTYNRAAFLPAAIEAIKSQEFEDWELIIVDDGSNDGTKESLPALVATVRQKVHLVSQSNQGAYAARNTGLGLVEGELVAFYDSDDLWLSHHLRDCVAALESNPMWAGFGERVEL